MFDLSSKIKKLESEIEEGKVVNNSFLERTAALEKNLIIKTDDLSNSRRENEDHKAQTEEKILYLQMQLNSMRGKEEQSAAELGTLRKDLEGMTATVIEREIAFDQKKDIVEKLQNKLFENEEEMTSFRGRVSELERNLTATKLLKDEKEALLLASRRDLKGVVDSRDQILRKLQELEEYKLKTENVTVKLAGERLFIFLLLYIGNFATVNNRSALQLLCGQYADPSLFSNVYKHRYGQPNYPFAGRHRREKHFDYPSACRVSGSGEERHSQSLHDRRWRSDAGISKQGNR